MQILTVSDEIVPSVYSLNIRQRFAGVELLLSCGDLPYYYLEFAVSTLNVPCYYVFGNHDTVEISDSGEELRAPRGCISLEGRCDHYGGLLLAGLGGCVRYNRDDGPQYTEREMALRVLRLAPQLFFNRRRYGRYLDVMLAHSPPQGIHDMPQGAHRGFVALRRLIERFAPRYFIHGHVHRTYNATAAAETQHGTTLVLNTAGYRTLIITP